MLLVPGILLYFSFLRVRVLYLWLYAK